MIAIVTGASGFVGQHLVRRLAREGHEVRCLVRAAGGRPPDAGRPFPVRFEDSRTLVDCPALDGAEVVFHLAAATKAVRASAFTAANVVPTRNLLGALRARRLGPRFVYVSSQAAAGPADQLSRPVDETDPPRPVEAYGRSKLEAERVVESFADHVPATIVRPSAVFGPGDRDFFKLFQLAERGIVLYPGTAEHWLSVLHVDDLVDGLLRAAAAPRAAVAPTNTFFLASMEPVQWRALGEHIAHIVGRPARHVDLYAPIVQTASLAGEWLGRLTHTATLANRSKAALSRHPFWICSARRARLEFGFRESRPLADALRDTYVWYRRNGWLRGSHGPGSAVA